MNPSPQAHPAPSGAENTYPLTAVLTDLEKIKTYLLDQEELKHRMLSEHAPIVQHYEDRLANPSA